VTPLLVELQDGFRDDTVVVSVGGSEVARREGVTTNLAISRADSIELAVDDGETDVEIEVPTRGISQRVPVEVSGRTYVVASLAGDGLVLRATQDQPYYL
jgi:hypothetical protein